MYVLKFSMWFYAMEIGVATVVHELNIYVVCKTVDVAHYCVVVDVNICVYCL
jgi:hypothetical protein